MKKKRKDNFQSAKSKSNKIKKKHDGSPKNVSLKHAVDKVAGNFNLLDWLLADWYAKNKQMKMKQNI